MIAGTWVKPRRYVVIGLLAVTLFLSCIPFIQAMFNGGYHGALTAPIDDELYYYGRMKEVADGKLFIGNPYFIEYRDAPAPAFFVADWLAAAPLVLGVPFDVTIILNFVVWSLVFACLAFLFVRAMDVPLPYAGGIAIFAYLEVYWLIYRPVVMQEVFPFFIFFLLSALVWLRSPVHRRSIFLLIISSASSFYIYTYLWQVVVTILGLMFLSMSFRKRWREVRSLIFVAVGTAIVALPAIVYTLYQIRAPFYWETVARIGLVESHLPTLNAYYYGRWALVVSVLYLLVQRWLSRGDFVERDRGDVAAHLVAYSGFGLLIMTVSNVLTGKDLDTAWHIGRLIILWTSLVFLVVLWRLWEHRRRLRRLPWFKLALIGLLSISCLWFLATNLRRSLPFERIANTSSAAIQGYAEPLAWLDSKERQPVVIWADDMLSTYVPILTKHYVLWSSLGALQIMPTSELEDRFLASRMHILTPDELRASYSIFGAGPGWRYADARAKNHIRCLVGLKCMPDQSFDEWIGRDTFSRLLKRQIALRHDMRRMMSEYHVAYIIADLSLSEDKYFGSLPGATEIWNNSRFIIYRWQ